jgi:hypothetical protein
MPQDERALVAPDSVPICGVAVARLDRMLLDVLVGQISFAPTAYPVDLSKTTA